MAQLHSSYERTFECDPPLGGLQDKTCAREMRSGVRTLHLAGAIHYPHTPLISAAFHIIAQPPSPTPLLKHKSHGSEMSTSVHGSQSTKPYIGQAFNSSTPYVEWWCKMWDVQKPLSRLRNRK